MKKVFVLIISLLLAVFAFTGCGSLFNCGNTTVSSTLMTEKPWKNDYNYEKISYKVTRYSVVYSENKDGEQVFDTDKTVAEGNYTVTLGTIAQDIKESSEFKALCENFEFSEYFTDNISKSDSLTKTAGAYSVITADYSITYNDEAANGDYAGKTDSIQSLILFRNANLMPVFSYKKADLQASGITYTAIADYVNGVNKFTENGKAAADVSIKENYDNELLYYLIRSQTGIESGTGTTLNVHNSVETGVYGKEAVNVMAVNVDGNSYYVNGIDADDTGFCKEYLGDSVQYVDEEEKAKREEEAKKNGEEIEVSVGYEIPAKIVTVGRNTQNRGPSTTLAYSSVDFTYYGNVMKNVLLNITGYEVDTEKQQISYMNMITISDYTIIQ